jgi:hypothetical protein
MKKSLSTRFHHVGDNIELYENAIGLQQTLDYFQGYRIFAVFLVPLIVEYFIASY